MSTLSDVAAAAGVSVSAVSRVLSGSPKARVSAETRERIHAAARELDYRPNFAARALKSSRTNVVGLVVPDLTNAIFTELMHGVEEEALRRGFMVLIARAEGMPEGEESIPRLVGEGRVDGVLVQIGDNMRAEDLQSLREADLPLIFINSVDPDRVGSVILEDELATRIATEHLIELGHRRIGLMGGLPATDSSHRRESGFRQAMAAAGLDVDPDLVTALGYGPAQGRAALARLSDQAEPPSAIVIANVNAAHGALREARSRGIHVPEQLSIVAIHDTWTAENTWPPLTTVRMPLYEMGQAAVIDLAARIGGAENVDRVVRDPAPRLILRESTAPPERPLTQ